MYELGQYKYIDPYEWDWQRKERVYTYPDDFFMLPDDPRPFVKVHINNSDGEYIYKVYLSDMTYLGV
jgi:hypothetical protein